MGDITFRTALTRRSMRPPESSAESAFGSLFRLRDIGRGLCVEALPEDPQPPALGAREYVPHPGSQIAHVQRPIPDFVANLPIGDHEKFGRVGYLTAGVDDAVASAEELRHGGSLTNSAVRWRTPNDGASGYGQPEAMSAKSAGTSLRFAEWPLRNDLVDAPDPVLPLCRVSSLVRVVG